MRPAYSCCEMVTSPRLLAASQPARRLFAVTWSSRCVRGAFSTGSSPAAGWLTGGCSDRRAVRRCVGGDSSTISSCSPESRGRDLVDRRTDLSLQIDLAGPTTATSPTFEPGVPTRSHWSRCRASPTTIALYITMLAETRKPSTIRHRLASISVAHQVAGSSRRRGVGGCDEAGAG
jgi:hypothetical protein